MCTHDRRLRPLVFTRSLRRTSRRNSAGRWALAVRAAVATTSQGRAAGLAYADVRGSERPRRPARAPGAELPRGAGQPRRPRGGRKGRVRHSRLRSSSVSATAANRQASRRQTSASSGRRRSESSAGRSPTSELSPGCGRPAGRTDRRLVRSRGHPRPIGGGLPRGPAYFARRGATAMGEPLQARERILIGFAAPVAGATLGITLGAEEARARDGVAERGAALAAPAAGQARNGSLCQGLLLGGLLDHGLIVRVGGKVLRAVLAARSRLVSSYGRSPGPAPPTGPTSSWTTMTSTSPPWRGAGVCCPRSPRSPGARALGEPDPPPPADGGGGCGGRMVGLARVTPWA